MDESLTYNAWIAFLLTDDPAARSHTVLGRLWSALAEIRGPFCPAWPNSYG
jgi:hypothetical protein